MARKKILFLSDAVSATSGLGRITRDLAVRVHNHLGEYFEVASVGYGGPGSKSIPFHEYHLHDVANWLVPELPQVWNDFAGDEEGILMCVWDLSRLYWLGIPQTCPNPFLRRWVESVRESRKVKLWTSHAIDAEGPNGKVSARIADTMKGFDRVLDYSEFSSKVTGNPVHLPHGIDTSVFYPRDFKESREAFMKGGFPGLRQDSLLIGIVATNQARKNWQLGMETCKILLDRGHDVYLWAHTDIMDRYWSLGTLIHDYGLSGRVAITNQRFTDDNMAKMYSACDVTLSIAPEGFGFSSAESMACGVPTVCGSYAAQAEFVPRLMQVIPVAYHYEGAFCSKRPVFHAEDWANKADFLAAQRRQVASKSLLPERVDWNGSTLWPSWEKWFLEGL
jgi:glycosyltransferase involved in cell wall biosynthesis